MEVDLHTVAGSPAGDDADDTAGMPAARAGGDQG
jgi:hypothetical protein